MDLYQFDFFYNLFCIFSKYQVVFFATLTLISYFLLVNLIPLRNALSTSLSILFPKYLFSLSIGIILTYFLTVILYAFSPLYLDHSESSVSIIGFLLKRNYELYPSLISGKFYGVPYGPILFLLQKWFYIILGNSIEVSKLVGVLSSIFSFIILYFAIHNHNNYKKGLYLIAYILIVILQFSNWAFWNRSEPIIMLFIGLALFGIRQNNIFFSLVLLSISFGFAINLKITSVFYMLPIFLLSLKQKSTWFHTALICLSLLITVLPFLYKNISFYNYLDYIRLARNEKMCFTLFYDCLKFSFLYYFIPTTLFLLYLTKHKEHLKRVLIKYKLPLIALFVCLVAVMLMGAKTGGGKLYMLPFMPIFVYFWSKLINIEFDSQHAKISNTKSLILLSLILGLLFSTIPTSMLKTGYMLLRFSRNLEKDAIPRQVIDDLKKIDRQYPDFTIHMGIGEYKDYKYTYYRPALVYMGNPYYIDIPIYMAYQNANMLDRKQLDQIFKDCKIDIWLIPKGNTPFYMGNFAGNHIPLFDQQLRNSFLNNYGQINSSKFFDVYKCKTRSKP
jgi:hypothetical protein